MRYDACMHLAQIRTRGFSLIEVVASLFVIAVIIVLSQAVLHIIPLGALAKHQDIALKIAAHQLEELRALGYDDLPGSGTFSHPDLVNLPQGEAEQTIATFNPRTEQVTVTVSWSEPSNPTPYSVSLTTLLTEIGGI